MNRRRSCLCGLFGFLSVLGFVSCAGKDSRLRGISVGNGMAPTEQVTYISPYQYRFQYSGGLKRKEDALRKHVIITNRDLVTKEAQASEMQIEVIQREVDYPGFAKKSDSDRNLDGLKALLKVKYPGSPLTQVDFRSVQGYYFPVSTEVGVHAKYFLLNGNLDLIIISLKARSEGHGMEWVAPILKTFRGDSRPPDLAEIRMEPSVLGPSGHGRILFKALDPSGISLNLPKANVLVGPESFTGEHEADGQAEVSQTLTPLGGGQYALDFRIGPYAASGTHKIKKLVVTDQAGNAVVFPLSNGTAPDVTFQVNNPDQDINGPKFIHAVPEKNQLLKPGDRLSLRLSLSDDISGVATGKNSGCAMLLQEKGRRMSQRLCGQLERLDKSEPARGAGGSYRLSIKTGPNWYPGNYRLEQVTVRDIAGNTSTFSSPASKGMARMSQSSVPRTMSPAPSMAQAAPERGDSNPMATEAAESGSAFPDLRFQVGTPQAASLTKISRVEFVPNEVTPGNSITMMIETSQGSSDPGPRKAKITLSAAAFTDDLRDVSFEVETEQVGSTFKASLPINAWQPLGRYVLRGVELLDTSGTPASWELGVAKPELIVR